MSSLCAHLIAGKAVAADATGATPVYNPSRGEVIAQAPAGTAAEVGQAVEAARKALPGWAETPVVERARILFRYKALLEEQFENLARLVTREHGKTLEEARGDVRRGIEVVELSCSIPSLIMGQALGNVARGIDGHVSMEPVGVCAGITPFNFPAMVPMWMYPLAIACGNTFVLKPSPKVPLTAIRLAEIALEAGLPPEFSTWFTAAGMPWTLCWCIPTWQQSVSWDRQPWREAFTRKARPMENESRQRAEPRTS